MSYGKQTYEVVVDDNFHYMDESERYVKGTYDTYEHAEAVAKQMVEEEVKHLFEKGMTAEKLYRNYMTFGADPFVVPDDAHEFSAWDYAKQLP